MRCLKMLLPAALLVFVAQGCASGPTFPMNGATTFKASSEFGVLVAKPDTYQGRAIRLAGKIVSVEATDQGTMITAEWLPFPVPGQNGPGPAPQGEPQRFRLLYPGQLDPMGRWYGNLFVVAGAMKGTTNMITLAGLTRTMPFVEARCIHVWKTGDSELSDFAADVEQVGFPPLEQTYCTKG